MQLTIKGVHIPDKLYGSGAQMVLLCLAFFITSLCIISAIAQYRQPVRYEKYNPILRKRSDALGIFGLFFCLASIGVYGGHLFNPVLPRILPLLLLATGLMALGLSRHRYHRSGRLENRKKWPTSMGAIVLLIACLSISLLGYQAFVPQHLNPFGVKMADMLLIGMSTVFSLFIVVSGIIYLRRTHKTQEASINQFNKNNYSPNMQAYIPETFYFLSTYSDSRRYLFYKKYLGKLDNDRGFKFLEACDRLYLLLEIKQSVTDKISIIQQIEHIYEGYISPDEKINIDGGLVEKFNQLFNANKKLKTIEADGNIILFLTYLWDARNKILWISPQRTTKRNFDNALEKDMRLCYGNDDENIPYNLYLIYIPIICGVIVESGACVFIETYNKVHFSLSSALGYITALALLGGCVCYFIGIIVLNKKAQKQISAIRNENIGYPQWKKEDSDNLIKNPH